MNIFVLDSNARLAAQYQCDKHVIKMCLETAQILCTAGHGAYKPAYVNHPCVTWAGASKYNWLWLYDHGIALCEEYNYRYGKHHKSEEVIRTATCDNLSPVPMTNFVLAMPEEYKMETVMYDNDYCTVESYRDYYMGAKKHLATWTRRELPYWWRV